MPVKDPRLTLAQWALLGLVAEQPRHGFALTKLLARSGEVGLIWSVPVSAVYRSLGALEQEGLVMATGVEPSDTGPQRTLYSISTGGRRRLEDWLDEPVVHIRDARSDLMLKLLLLERACTDPSRLLLLQATHFGRLLEALEASARTEGVLGRWRLENARGVMRFLDEARQTSR